ncbi:ABC transporter ATP-binding protein [Galbitalea sp. SE-J8]|uniref:ABC transporter ATP-binding protein n=1 Tax=Galbitalea sp. SE-J8 TaxID=3054952 RepID=UPI00259CD1CB|nr:ABC transporter ATP-binding protein [Galbitalea sp. SE-J8]MDM4763705.1 ABC transporter ATP-binding protein [Galbitalea sp. SE-J8]
MSRIALRNVDLSYVSAVETVVALDGVTLDAADGELVTVFGSSGSGKTTLLNVIGGLTVPDSGVVEVGGRNIVALSEADRADVRLRDVGVVFQDHNLIPEFTALENVMLPLRARGFSSGDARRAADTALSSVGVAGLGGRAPAQLSGGQKQRVGIARAIAGERGVLLADEPTGALDSENSRAVFGVLRDLARAGVCVLVATHDPLAREIADRVVTMSDGAVISDVASASTAPR